MAEFYLGVALFLLLNIAAGLIRIHRGPTPPDRMLAAQLFSTTGISILLLLGQATDDRAARDVALLFALLASLAAVAFVRRLWGSRGREEGR